MQPDGVAGIATCLCQSRIVVMALSHSDALHQRMPTYGPLGKQTVIISSVISLLTEQLGCQVDSHSFTSYL